MAGDITFVFKVETRGKCEGKFLFFLFKKRNPTREIPPPSDRSAEYITQMIPLPAKENRNSAISAFSLSF